MAKNNDPLVATDVNPSNPLANPDSGGQSGDDEGLSNVESATDESVEELNDEGQSIEADFVQGVEDAGDHPEQPVPRRDL